MRTSSDALKTHVAARIGYRLSSSAVLVGCVVALVATVGVSATLSSYMTLKDAGRERADSWLSAQTTQLRGSLGQAFEMADPVMDELERHLRSGQEGARAQALLPTMHALAAARPGLTWISVSFPDGEYVSLHLLEDGTPFTQTTRFTDEGVVEWDLTLDAEGRVHEGARRPSDYDPRQRPFYQLATRVGRRVWTEPYAFLPDLHTGVTRVHPVYQGSEPSTLLAVLTVDFDTVELTELLGDALVPGQRTLVVTGSGVVLAARGVELPPNEADALSVPTLRELRDDVLRGLPEGFLDAGEHAAEMLRLDSERYRVDVAHVASLSDQPIFLLTIVPESELYAAALAEARRGAGVTGVLTLLALLFALLLSASFANMRRKRAAAERAARLAEEQIQELGRYQLLALLGEGAMGEVYRARHTLLARDSALKLIRRDPTAARDTQVSASRLERRQQLFFDEARRLASLHSLHTVAVQDFGVAENGRYFLVMELLEGLDLATLVERYGPQPAGRVASILAQVCDSLAEAHDAGFVHQDIKPANIFLCRIAEALDFVKVLDFGLARKFGAGRDEEGRLEGTPAFMAPEQVQELAVGPAADFYGLGGVGFFLLTGKPPYDTRSRTALFYQHVHGEVPQLPEPLRASVPAELAELLTQCLAKDPAARPASARDLAASFHRLASASPLEFGDAERERFWKEWEAAGGGQAQGTPIPRHDVSRSMLKVRFDSAYSIRREGA